MRNPIALGIFLLTALSAAAHELRPAYLELRETAPNTFDALWKVPAAGDQMRLALYVRLPDNCVNLTEPVGMFAGGAYLERWRLKAPDGLSGGRITIDGLASTMTDALVRVEFGDGRSTWVKRLTAAESAAMIPAHQSAWAVSGEYLRLGVEHILLGVDHLLFVLALLILVRGWKRLLGTITAFTVAHSFTLVATTLGFVHVPGPPVEACIALSIVFVAAEIIRAGQGRVGVTARWPWIVAFTFGLLHGFGFAGALSEVGLPDRALPVALLCFNLGVEAGQLLFVSLVLSTLALVRRCHLEAPLWTKLAPPYAIGGLAMFWVIQRIATF